MKVVHLNVSDTKGGAARAAYRLHQGLRQAGIDSSMVVSEKYSDETTVIVPLRDRLGYYERRFHYRQLAARFWRYAPTRPPGLSPFTQPSASRNRHLLKKIPKVDIINFHWIAHFVDLPTFFTGNQLPLVWTLHDMNVFTGGCHYALDCDRYLKQCGACPQLGSKSNQDASRKNWIIKKNLYHLAADKKLHFVTPSKWLAKEARRSSLLKDMPITVIANGLDTDVFVPHDRSEARQQLGIPAEAKVILFSANSIVDQRKGLSYLLLALEGMQDQPNLLLVTLGAGHINHDGPLPVMDLGHVNDAHQIALAYSAADLFVIPSMQDNLPNTVMEAMACGTPVIGFEVGGIPEMVRDGISGQLVPLGNIDQLRLAILSLINEESRLAEMAVNCRQIAEREYSLHAQAEKYIKLYRRLLESEAPSR